MQNNKTLLTLLFLSVLSLPCQAAEEKATENVKISEQAISNYGIQTTSVARNQQITLPRSAFAVSKNEYFAYAKKDGGFIEIELHGFQPENGNLAFLNKYEVDEFVTDGAKYLRIIFLSQQNQSSGHGHGH